MQRGNTVQDFSSLWLNYIELYQRSLQDFARLLVPNLPTADAKSANGGSQQFDPLSAFSPDAWNALFTPWLSQDAASNPFAGLTEATQASLKAFAPWGEAFTAFGAVAQPKATPEDKNLSSAERAARDAIKRSKTQDI